MRDEAESALFEWREQRACECASFDAEPVVDPSLGDTSLGDTSLGDPSLADPSLADPE